MIATDCRYAELKESILGDNGAVGLDEVGIEIAKEAAENQFGAEDDDSGEADVDTAAAAALLGGPGHTNDQIREMMQM